MALKAMGVKVIDFTGGEPLLHRDIASFFALAHSMGFITTLTTNGLLYPKRANALAGKVDMLHFSLDAATASAHDKSRGVPCFDKVMESIEIALALGEQPDILFTFSDENAHEAQAIYQTICKPKNLMLILNPMFTYGPLKNPMVSSKTLAVMEKLAKNKGVYMNEGFAELIRQGGNDKNKPVCKAGHTTVVISPKDCLILPCYHAGLNEFLINGNLQELWNSQIVLSERKKAGYLQICQGCTVNCYMQPSMATYLNHFFWLALPSTIKYNYQKGTWRRLLAKPYKLNQPTP